MIFSRANTLKQYEKLGLLNIVREKADKGLLVRILIGTDNPVNFERSGETDRNSSKRNAKSA